MYEIKQDAGAAGVSIVASQGFFYIYIYFNVTFSRELPLSTNLFNLGNDLRTNLGELFC